MKTVLGMTWAWNHRNGNACTSSCGRWVITELYAAHYELWDCKERRIIGVYESVTKAQKAAEGL